MRGKGNMYIRKFEVKTGKNRGLYIVTDTQKDKLYKELADKWGILQSENYNGFYNYHGVNQYDCLIWTHSTWAYSVMREEYNRY
jgi:hypothetical protein